MPCPSQEFAGPPSGAFLLGGTGWFLRQPARAGAWLMTSLLAAVVLVVSAAVAAEPTRPTQQAIASAHPLATEAGMEVLDAGGNAFDAAIAVSAVLAVVEQTSSGIGGGGFWLLHRAADDFEIMVDAREQAPAAAHKDMYLNEDGSVNRDLAVNGPLAAAIPGEIAGLEHLAQHYGRLSLARNLQPAIRIAREGFPVYEKYHSMAVRKRETLLRWPGAAEALLDGGEVPEIAQVIAVCTICENIKVKLSQFFLKGLIYLLFAKITPLKGICCKIRPGKRVYTDSKQPAAYLFYNLSDC